MTSSKVGFVSLGCPKALVDSERILTQLRSEGYEISQEYDEANVVVVNTCGFIDSARAESLEAIGEAIHENGKVIVTGCLGIHEEEIRKAHPQVLSVTGPQQYEQVVGAVRQYAPLEQKHDPFTNLLPEQGVKLTPRHYAYLKISEGCNHKCSFCIIPSMRGKLKSRLIDEVMQEAEGLQRAGVKELLIISQDTSAYGSDVKYQSGLWKGEAINSDLQNLCMALGSLGIWVRLHYVYPYPHVDKIIPLMNEGALLPYLDIPFQHGSTQVLKRMRRPAATENTLKRIQTWRNICPELTIRSTFIVGFPGESDKEFEELLTFLKEAQLDRVGCFQYSAVDGAEANKLGNHIVDEVKQERWEQFMQLQLEISAQKLQRKVGSIISVLIDEVNGDEIVGRSSADAPEIDGVVYVTSKADLQAGDLVEVEIESTSEYDLWGQHKFNQD
ncbi:MAG: 30S ribosomal protein S12 methylthiotransferase RimO [Gammaproteobacteria bacterium]|nr:30S ribosomal protein S12 methylthiotransferase RimO [Gammaproteobacteria bacterium]